MNKCLIWNIFICVSICIFSGKQVFAYNSFNTSWNNYKSSIPKSFIYGYNNSLVIAEVVNAINEEIAYSSFEDNSTGNWAFNSSGVQTEAGKKSITGIKYYTLTTGSITKSFSISPGKNIIVSYWSRAGGQTVNASSGQAGRSVIIDGYTWTYFEHLLINPSSITVSGTAVIDELRLYPEEAIMITYTYDPLIGVTSKCDANNQIIYYEYDIFSRLLLVRNQDYKILKKYCYGYAGLVQDCSQIFYSIVKSGQFVRTNCGSGYTGSTVTYTVPYGTYFSSDQNEANQLAQNDLDANGPIYANINGTCTLIPPPPPPITIMGYNTQSKTYKVRFTNNSTGAVTEFTLPAYTYNPITLGTVPSGTYAVLFFLYGSPPPATCTYNINGFTYYGTGASFSNISITTTSTASMY